MKSVENENMYRYTSSRHTNEVSRSYTPQLDLQSRLISQTSQPPSAWSAQYSTYFKVRTTNKKRHSEQARGVWTRRTLTARRANALRVFVTSYPRCARKMILTHRQVARPHGAHLELESALDCES